MGVRKKIGILEASDFSKKAIEDLLEHFDVEIFTNGEIKEFILDKYAIFIRLKYHIDEHILSSAKELKYICSPTTGLNHIDINYAKNNLIGILSLKNENDFLKDIRATAEHIIGLALSLIRNYKKIYLMSSIDNYIWDRELFKGDEIFGLNIGIIGMGRIGILLAKYFNAFDANIYYYDIKGIIKNKYNAIYIDGINQLIQKTDLIILNADYKEENYKLINEKYIDLMKDKYLINASRGEMIDEDYLIKKIETDHFKGIAIDVVANEAEVDNKIKDFSNLINKANFILTPHIGGATFTSMRRTEEFIAKKLINAYLSKTDGREE